MRYLKSIFGKTPQREQLAGRTDQVVNSEGGYVWAVDNWKRLDRFLILGSEQGTYYIAERQLTVENVSAVQACLKEDGARVVRILTEISQTGRAPKNDPALFVLAMASSPKFADPATNTAALAALPKVARTGTHLCNFAAFADSVRGWGRGLRNAIGAWYLDKPAQDLAYQLAKYQQRGGWSHRDLLRKAHPKTASAAHNALLHWVVDGELRRITPELATGELRQIHAMELARKATEKSEIVRLIEDYRLTHEMIPNNWKTSAEVWEALLESMPYTAMLRNLGKLTAVGLLAPGSHATALVVARLIDRKRIAGARVHPIALLSALLVYKRGTGVRGGLEWAPVANVIDALDDAFYVSFETVQPTGRHIYLGLDASGSMQGTACNGISHLTADMASAAMAMVFARTEPNHTIAAFHDRIWHVDITRKDRLDRACQAIVREPRGTNAALPMEDALQRRLKVDAFLILTDSETWAGDQHPVQALDRYRQKTGIAARLIVVAMAANRYSIADPNDALQMDVVGFDTSVPGVIANFIRE